MGKMTPKEKAEHLFVLETLLFFMRRQFEGTPTEVDLIETESGHEFVVYIDGTDPDS